MDHGREACMPGRASSGLILGAGVILVGVLLLLQEVPGLTHSPILAFLLNLWPLILVAMGFERLRHPTEARPRRGWALVVVGCALLFFTLGQGRFDALIAPVLVVTAGIFIVLRALRRRRGILFAEVPSEDYLRGTAVLSGFKQQIRSRAFRGGELTAIFGGFDLDLRSAAMAGDSARIEVFLMFGGGELKVPPEWEVAIQATAVAGGVADKTPPAQLPGEQRPRLVISGLILFGGIEIKP